MAADTRVAAVGSPLWQGGASDRPQQAPIVFTAGLIWPTSSLLPARCSRRYEVSCAATALLTNVGLMLSSAAVADQATAPQSQLEEIVVTAQKRDSTVDRRR